MFTVQFSGKILVDLRKRFKESKDATVAVSQTMAVMLSSLLNVPAVAPSPARPPLIPPHPWAWPSKSCRPLLRLRR